MFSAFKGVCQSTHTQFKNMPKPCYILQKENIVIFCRVALRNITLKLRRNIIYRYL